MIINLNDINELCRPCYADADIAARFIDEAEYIDIKGVIGDKTYLEVVNAQDDDAYDLFFNGGTYRDSNGRTKINPGLKKAIAYFAYSRIVKSGSSVQTRFGFVQKEDEYSAKAEYKERLSVANETLTIAMNLLSEVVSYMYASGLFVNLPNVMTSKNHRTTFKIVGD